MGVTVDQAIADLSARLFIERYEVDGQRYLSLPNFARHQLVSRDEPASEIPAPDGSLTPYERAPNETVRARIYVRDNYTCAYCGRQMSKTPRVRCVDHVIPCSRGGSHRDENLVTACKRCNAKKGARTPIEAELPWPQGLGSLLTPCQHSVNGSGQEGELGIRDLELGIGERESRADAAPTAADVAVAGRFAEEFKSLWNSTTSAPISQCRDVTAKRRRQIRLRLTERPLMEWQQVFERIQTSAFCRGENDRGWLASFDWVVGSPDVAVKVLEGKYDNRKPMRTREPPERPEWKCPDDPPCAPGTSQFRCHQRAQLEAAKKARAS